MRNVFATVLLFWTSSLSLLAQAQSVPPTLTFAPAQPSSNDSITATLSEALCNPFVTQISGNTVTIVQTGIPFSCPPDPSRTESVTFGPLPAGLYQVQLLFWPGSSPFVTASLQVTQAALPTTAAAAPLLGWLQTLILLLGIGALGLSALKVSRAG